MLKIPKAIQEAIVSQALEEDPNECCGLLSGVGETVSLHYRIRNQDQSPTTYLMDPKEQIHAFADMRDHQIDLLAIYHSHTHTPAWPSATDIRLAYYPECYYLIISLQEKKTPQMRLFRIIDGKVTEKEFEII